MQVARRVGITIFIGMLPALIIYIGLALIPIAMSFYYSFYDWNGLSAMTFTGLDNYISIFKDRVFWGGVKNNLFMMATGILGQLPLGLFFALLLNRSLKGIKFYRSTLFLPVIISAVIVSLIWSMVYGTESGLINNILKNVGLGTWKQNWLGSKPWGMISVSITYLWQNYGFYMVIFLAGLQNIPEEVKEAAVMDGASSWKRFWLVTLPMLKETIWVTLIFSISNSFKIFDLIYVMTAGGPAHNTEVMTIYMYTNAFNNMSFGLGSAVSILILLFSLIVIYAAKLLTAARN
ncbi:sugar ABC transporter permease [Paenibacillus sp. GP183]|jgi:raffinose/stachyose/melibiose transport system permease protein|uniref:carbohydrate ABC transporter permease n=1 Tax=Paenibacillus sp. GP183 TaxID=1882751 RepID=UPI00089BF2E4|nr:sugar ABC transporter permease [Paenibacillus sp. GP183]SEC61673.1 carbohydrate ABC transporter membrane protein 1, CUT1 family [Paenibacillus sp. GP183]